MRKIINALYWKQATETRTETEVLMDFSLSRITFLNTQEKLSLAGKIKTPEEFSKLSLEEISSLVCRSFPKAQWNGEKNLREAVRELEVCKRMKIGWLKITDPEYPVMLKTLSNPPYLLFYRGNLGAFEQKAVSVVGTRKLSPGGKKAGLAFAKDAVKSGVCVVSGLAWGADGVAHKGAVETFYDYKEQGKETESLGKTIGVLPCSIDSIVPANHLKLAEDILKSGGLLISEYAPMTPMGNWHFVQRNRIIAALSPATVVLEAPNGSGALITVDYALEMGRDVMFHESCFSEYAKKINEGVKKNLEIEYNNKKISRHKLEVSSEQYVQEGAPVIKNYEDYCKALAEVPGTRSANKIKQLDLFD